MLITFIFLFFLIVLPEGLSAASAASVKKASSNKHTKNVLRYIQLTKYSPGYNLSYVQDIQEQVAYQCGGWLQAVMGQNIMHGVDALLAASPVIADFAKIVDFPNEEAWQNHLNCLIPIVGNTTRGAEVFKSKIEYLVPVPKEQINGEYISIRLNIPGSRFGLKPTTLQASTLNKAYGRLNRAKAFYYTDNSHGPDMGISGNVGYTGNTEAAYGSVTSFATASLAAAHFGYNFLGDSPSPPNAIINAFSANATVGNALAYFKAIRMNSQQIPAI